MLQIIYYLDSSICKVGVIVAQISGSQSLACNRFALAGDKGPEDTAAFNKKSLSAIGMEANCTLELLAEGAGFEPAVGY
ncbi:hypothetical protein [Comamonas sp.]